MSSIPVLDLEKILAPIAGANPAGEDLRYSDLYDLLRKNRRTVDAKVMARAASKQRAKRDAQQPDADPDEEQSTDRAKQLAQDAALDPGGPSLEDMLGSISRDASGALINRSKDLQLAIWVLEAHARLSGFAGAALGLQVVRGVVEHYWDNGYPSIDPEDDEPLTARIGMLEWISEKLPIVLRSVQLNDGAEEWTVAEYEIAQMKPSAATLKALKITDHVNAYSVERFHKAMSETDITHLEALSAGIASCHDEIGLLEKATDTRCVVRQAMPDGTQRTLPQIGFRKVVDLLDHCKSLVDVALGPKLEARGPVATEAETPADPSAPGDGTPAARPVMRAPAGAIADRADAIARLRTIAEFLATENSADPTPYLLTRALAFGPLFACSDVSETAPLTSPPTAVRTNLKTMVTESRWDELIKAAERQLAASDKQAWLDVQRYAVTALEQLGGHDQAAKVIRSQLKSLLEFLPGLPDAEFEDGTPVANQDTRRWLRETELIESAGPVALRPEMPVQAADPGASADAQPQATAPAIMDQVLPLIRAKRTDEALALLQQHVSEAISGRDRFLRRLDLAEVCLDAGNPTLAYPILDELASTIERVHLEDWEEKALVVRAWSALVRCCRQMESDPQAKARGNDIFAKLCRIDLAKALRLDKDSASSSSRWQRR